MNNYEGYEVDKDLSTDDKIVLVKKKAKQVESWEDLGKIDGYSAVNFATVLFNEQVDVDDMSKSFWATHDQALAQYAMSQLSQLMLRANEGWTPDWSDAYECKFCLCIYDHEVDTQNLLTTRRFLAFKSEEIMSKFLELHRDLIEQARPLL